MEECCFCNMGKKLFSKNNLLSNIGMCNSDRLLDYLAVTAMIDHENDDRGEKLFRLLKQHFGQPRHPEL